MGFSKEITRKEAYGWLRILYVVYFVVLRQI